MAQVQRLVLSGGPCTGAPNLGECDGDACGGALARLTCSPHHMRGAQTKQLRKARSKSGKMKQLRREKEDIGGLLSGMSKR